MRLCPPMHGLTDLNVWSIHLGCVNMYVSDWCTGKKNDRDPSHALFLMHFLNSIFTCLHALCILKCLYSLRIAGLY